MEKLELTIAYKKEVKCPYCDREWVHEDEIQTNIDADTIDDLQLKALRTRLREVEILNQNMSKALNGAIAGENSKARRIKELEEENRKLMEM